MRGRLLFAVLAIACASSVRAEIVATCGESEGWAYYIPGPIVPLSKAGWTTDKVSKGQLQLIRSGDDWDMVFTDASGGTFSAEGDGATTLGEMTKNGDVVVSVFYGKSWETYVFWLSLTKPTVSYSQAKFAAGVQKHPLMVAPCRRGP